MCRWISFFLIFWISLPFCSPAEEVTKEQKKEVPKTEVKVKEIKEKNLLEQYLKVNWKRPILRKVEDILQNGNPNINIPTIKKVLKETKSGITISRCFFALAYYNVKSEDIPAPRREALCEYFGEYFFYDFHPIHFWAYYPEKWQDGMRNILHDTIKNGYEVQNLNHAVCIIKLFFDEKRMSEEYNLASLIKAANYSTSQITPKRWEYKWHRNGMKCWVNAIWKHSKEKQQEEIIAALYLNPTLRSSKSSKQSPSSPQVVSAKYSQEDILPIREWLMKYPDKIGNYLAHSNRKLRQETLMFATEGKEKDYLVDVSDPNIINLLIEGLEKDSIPGNQERFAAILSANSVETLTPMKNALTKSRDREQKTTLENIIKSIKVGAGTNK